jgi:hypothetical protein
VLEECSVEDGRGRVVERTRERLGIFGSISNEF